MNCNKHKFVKGIALKDLIRTVSCVPTEGIDIWRGCQWINVKKCSICGYSVEIQNNNPIFEQIDHTNDNKEIWELV